MEITGLLSYMLDGTIIDFSRLISNELKRITLSNTQLGERITCQLTYPGLIMGLCKKAKVKIPDDGHNTIEWVINDNFIDHFCISKQVYLAEGSVSVAAAPPAQP
ncbi:hypothetical protein RYX36_027730 [Vicia faba]